MAKQVWTILTEEDAERMRRAAAEHEAKYGPFKPRPYCLSCEEYLEPGQIKSFRDWSGELETWADCPTCGEQDYEIDDYYTDPKKD